MLTITAVAEKHGIHKSTVRGWIRSGRLNAIRTGHRTVMIRDIDLETFFKGCETNKPTRGHR